MLYVLVNLVILKVDLNCWVRSAAVILASTLGRPHSSISLPTLHQGTVDHLVAGSNIAAARTQTQLIIDRWANYHTVKIDPFPSAIGQN